MIVPEFVEHSHVHGRAGARARARAHGHGHLLVEPSGVQVSQLSRKLDNGAAPARA